MNKFLIWVFCIGCSAAVVAQKPGIRPVAEQWQQFAAYNDPLPVNLFTPAPNTRSADLTKYVRESTFLTVNPEAVATIRNSRPNLISLSILDGESTIILELYRTEVFGPGYAIRTSDGGGNPDGFDFSFYRGIVSGDPESVAAVTFIGDEARLLFSDRSGDRRVHKMHDETYAFYKDKDVVRKELLSCGVDESLVNESSTPGVQERVVMSGNCVQVYFECDYESYLDNNSSVANVEAWVAALFNEVATLYENEEIPVFISEIMVWTSADPYRNLNSTSAMLDAFVDEIANNGYNGRLAHLLSTRGLGGGIAYVNVLCSNSNPCAVSTSLSTNIVQFPNYSWNVEVVTHEMGHNFGSRHTHNCVWNGNSTQIDDCGSVAGDEQSCYDENDPILPEDGTIMSYCHLVGGVGINFSLGFGTQPGDLIRSKYESASCNTGVCSPPPCVELTNPQHLSTDIDIAHAISWSNSDGADGYKVTVGTSPGSGDIVNNIDIGDETTYDPPGSLPFNSNIYVKVVPYNIVGNSTGCSNEYFTTESSGAPLCTSLNSPDNGATDVPVNTTFAWDHAVGNQLGYKVSAGTAPGGSDILNAVDAGNVTEMQPEGLPYNTLVYARVEPYWQQGDITGCPEISFTTGGPIYCNSQGNSSSYEWISEVTLGTSANTSGSTGYSDFTDQIFDIAGGGSYPISITPSYDGQVYAENFRVWIDYDRNGVFSDPEERVFQASDNNEVTGTIEVPLSASTGTTRMRVAMKWGSYSTPCQSFDYGEVEDYTVRIHCNLVSTTGDSGAGSLPWALGCASPGESILFANSLQGDTIVLENNPAIVGKSLNITAGNEDDIWVKGSAVSHTFEILQGFTVSIHGLHIIAGMADEGSAIDNGGDLTMHNIQIKRHPGQALSKVIRNNGTLHLSGAIMIE